MRGEELWRPTKFGGTEGLGIGPEASAQSWLATLRVGDAYRRHLSRFARGRLVDLGCGQVPLYAAYRPFVQEVVCVDWAGQGASLPHVDIEHDLNQPLPFEDQCFDTVLLSDVLEHLHRPAQVLQEIHRILVPGGMLIANVPFLYWLHSQPYDYFRYTEHGLRILLEQAGLALRELEIIGGGPDVVVDVVSKHLVQVPVVGRSAARALQRAAYSLTRVRGVSALLRQSSQRFPLGYLVVAERLPV